MGLTMDMFGPTSLRRNDMHLYRLSNINNRIHAENERVSNNCEYEYCGFGDSAYRGDSNFRSYLLADNNADFGRWNTRMKKVRISIEWNYGSTSEMFKFLQLPRKMRLLANPRQVSKVYTVCTLFRNFYTILNGNQTSAYFNYTFPVPSRFINCYINQTDLHEA
jgi:hypothetical protein